MPKRTIEAADLLTLADYLPRRAEARTRIAEIKKHRRLEVGPFATFYFESWDTIRHQIQEMLYIEKGGDEQLADELEAYGPLVPRGNELSATVMFEIDDPVRRLAALNRIGGIENHMFLGAGGRQVRGVPDAERENTSPEGKASSVQFCHFPLDTETVAAFRATGSQVLVGFDHPSYGHIAVMPETVRAALAEDL